MEYSGPHEPLAGRRVRPAVRGLSACRRPLAGLDGPGGVRHLRTPGAGRPMLATGPGLSWSAVPAAFQYGLWDSTVRDRCRRLELLLLTDLDGGRYWHASLAAAVRAAGATFRRPGAVAGDAVLGPGRAGVAARGGRDRVGVLVVVGFRRPAAGCRRTASARCSTTGPAAPGGWPGPPAPVLARRWPAGGGLAALTEPPSWRWLPGPLLAGLLTLAIALARSGRVRVRGAGTTGTRNRAVPPPSRLPWRSTYWQLSPPCRTTGAGAVTRTRVVTPVPIGTKRSWSHIRHPGRPRSTPRPESSRRTIAFASRAPYRRSIRCPNNPRSGAGQPRLGSRTEGRQRPDDSTGVVDRQGLAATTPTLPTTLPTGRRPGRVGWWPQHTDGD